MKNLIIIISLVFSVTTLSASYNITRQGQLNNFQYDSIIQGSLIITTIPGQDSSNMVYDLSPLLNIDTIFGNLVITKSALTNFSGLRNVVVTGGFYIYENEMLWDLTSLDGPRVVTEIEIYNNPILQVCSSFSMEISFRRLNIHNNPMLLEVQLQLDSLLPTYTNTFYVRCSFNLALKELSIKDKYSLLNKLIVEDNSSLNTIHVSTSNDSISLIWMKSLSELVKVSGFKDVRVIGMLNVLDNPKLQNLCFVKQILEKDGVGFMTLSNNGQGANTEAEILNTDCTDFNTGIGEINAFEELSFYPNPAHDEVFIKDLKRQEAYFIYDVSGKVINQGMVDLDGRISISGISNGMYVLMVGNKRSKFIVE
jgi:hypothetical protein